VCINCGAIPQTLLESTLFGHERGAFTGADQQRKGVFESADGGTVLLDEIGELPLPAQVALLRVLETKHVTRIGSTKEVPVDVRVLSATHRDLEALVAEGRFREDLLYRLNAFTLKIPPLRERREDIGPLSLQMLREASAAEGSQVGGIGSEAMAALEGYRWPGNVRELKNAMSRAAILADGRSVTEEDLPDRVRSAVQAPPQGWPSAIGDVGGVLDGDSDFRAIMERVEAHVLSEALRRHGWNQTETAKTLSMPLRTLQHKIAVHGLKKPRARALGDD
jgi:DNA-binding NtrC family response regulator